MYRNVEVWLKIYFMWRNNFYFVIGLFAFVFFFFRENISNVRFEFSPLLRLTQSPHWDFVLSTYTDITEKLSINTWTGNRMTYFKSIRYFQYFPIFRYRHLALIFCNHCGLMLGYLWFLTHGYSIKPIQLSTIAKRYSEYVFMYR